MHVENAIQEMEGVFKDIPYGIEHTRQVLKNAEYILDGEAVSGAIRETVCLAAILHDIGAVEAQKKHGSMQGHFQEIEGPPLAREILERSGAPAEMSERVCYIVGHHHTPGKIDGLDFQVLWEADTLEALLAEERGDEATLREKVRENFKTVTGRKLAQERLGISLRDNMPLT